MNKFICCLFLTLPGHAYAEENKLHLIAEKIATGDFQAAYEIIDERCFMGMCGNSYEYKDDFDEKVKIEKGTLKRILSSIETAQAKCEAAEQRLPKRKEYSQWDLEQFRNFPMHEIESDIKSCFPHSSYDNSLARIKLILGVDLSDKPQLFKSRYEDFMSAKNSARAKDNELQRRKALKAAEEINSPKSISERICNASNRILMAQQELNAEKEIEQKSGVTNLSRRRKLGELIYGLEKAIAQWKADYKERTSSNWKKNLCK